MRIFRWTALFLLGSCSLACAASLNIEPRGVERPQDTSVGYGEVYGYINTETDLRDSDEVSRFLDILTSERFASSGDGSFLVTLTISAAGTGKTLVEKPIISGVRKSKKFLWITTDSTVNGTLDLGGTILDGVMVGQDNNDLRVAFRTYFSDKVTFDTKAYADLLKLVEAAKTVSSLLAVPALITGNTDSISKLLESVMSHNHSQDVTIATQMSFINKSGFDTSGRSRASPNKQRFRITGADDDDNRINFNITVSFETRPSKTVTYDTARISNGPTRRGFAANAIPGRFLDKAVVKVGAEEIPIAELIEKSGPKPIANAWTMLRYGPYDSEKNGNIPIETICADLFTLIRKAFTERDAAGLYWDILISLKTQLAKTKGAVECVRSRQALFQAHGLKLDDLADVKN